MARFPTSHHESAALKSQLSIFNSDLGWFGLVGQGKRVTSLTFGHSTPGEVHEHLFAGAHVERLTSPADGQPRLRRRLQNYAAGRRVDFADIIVSDEDATPFQRRVRRVLRTVGFGETLSYANLAQRAGSPNAARAVGRVMATNPVPIIVPCHRVIASGGRLGGFSAPSGTDMKRRLLELEGVSEFSFALT